MPATVVEAGEAFLVTLRGKSPRTTSTYRTCLHVFQDFLAESDYDRMATTELPVDVLEQFYLWLVKEFGRDNPATINTYIAGTRAFFRHMERIGQGPIGTTYERIRSGLREIMARTHYKAPVPDEGLPLVVLRVNEALANLPNDVKERLILLRDRAILNVLYTTGMRREEVTRLDRRDIGDGWKPAVIITGKGDKQRVVFFDDDTLRHVRAYLAERADGYTPLFIQHGPARGRPRRGASDHRLSPQSVWKTVRRWSKLAGVDISTHDFRHTKATTLLNMGAPLEMVQDLLGHTSPATTKTIYAHYSREKLEQAFHEYSLSAADLARRRKEAHEPPEKKEDGRLG
jgi:site-specific recombinase XerD